MRVWQTEVETKKTISRNKKSSRFGYGCLKVNDV
jgi:hypothetical protein